MNLRRADSNRQRLASGACLLLHLLVVGWAPLADAALEAASAAEPIHIEAERDTGCARGHNHFFCQLCRAIELQITGPTRPALATPLAPVRRLSLAEAPEAPEAFSGACVPSPLGPRAPPPA